MYCNEILRHVVVKVSAQFTYRVCPGGKSECALAERGLRAESLRPPSNRGDALPSRPSTKSKSKMNSEKEHQGCAMKK